MKAEELIDIIRSGRKEGEDIRNMELLMEQFPYFATIRIVYLKMLHDSGHSAYPEKLKHNTIYIPDHKQFYRFLNNLLSDWDEVGNPVFKPEPVAIELLADKEEEKKERAARRRRKGGRCGDGGVVEKGRSGRGRKTRANGRRSGGNGVVQEIEENVHGVLVGNAGPGDLVNAKPVLLEEGGRMIQEAIEEPKDILL